MGGADKCPPIVVTGMLGAREGGYKLTIKMTPEEAEAFHESSVKLFADDPRVDVIQVYVVNQFCTSYRQTLKMSFEYNCLLRLLDQYAGGSQ